MAVKISKVIADLNVGRQTIEEFLHERGIEIDASINARIQDDVYEMLVKEFRPDLITEKRVQSSDSVQDQNPYLKNSPIADFDWDAYEKRETKRDNAFEELEKTYDRALRAIREGEVTEGTVISINKREVVVNINATTDGIIPVSEFRYNPDLKVGDTVEVYVEKCTESCGQVLLSHRRARLAKSWDRVIEAFGKNEIIKGYIKCRTKGGLIVDIFGIEAFLPGSQIDVHPIRNHDVYVDRTMEFKILKINQDYRSVIVSHRAIIEERIEKNRAEYHEGDIIEGAITNVVDYGFFMKTDDGFSGLVHRSDKPRIQTVKEGDRIKVKIKTISKEENGKKKVSLSVNDYLEWWALQHQEGEHIKVSVLDYNMNDLINEEVIRVTFDGIIVPLRSKKLIEPYISKFERKEFKRGDILEIVYKGYVSKQNILKLDMKPILKENMEKQIDLLRRSLEKGSICEAEVVKTRQDGALIDITGVSFLIPKDELSPNKVYSVDEEVFEGEVLEVVYTGEREGKLQFSRKALLSNIYDNTLFKQPITGLLKSMDILNNIFVGKVIRIKDDLFLSELIVCSGTSNDDNGQLLVDPYTGKNLLAIIDNRLRNIFEEGNYYEVSLEASSESYRRSQGTPYQFLVNKPGRSVGNPYKESVELAFKKLTSPTGNTSIANLLDEVGLNLYSSKKRMFFELLQNADDAAPKLGVQLKVQLENGYFIVTHNGFSFSKHDFDSITSAAKSTKSAKKEKTGYKGIGFKSVFTNSTSINIRTGGYAFDFDKENPEYMDFKTFYFHVNDIFSVSEKNDFLKKFDKEYKEFRGVKDLPWQLLPIWNPNVSDELSSTIFSRKNNVSIALRMDHEKLDEYRKALIEVFSSPRFMLFLRNTQRVQMILDDKTLTIQKTIKTNNSDVIYLKNSFSKKRTETYRLCTFDEIDVNDDSFKLAAVPIAKQQKTNNRGDLEIILVNIDDAGNAKSEVPGIPDRIASANKTSISFAMEIDESGQIIPVKSKESTLYAYLPMNENRFEFPFYINADFIPRSDREGIQNENPWNHFLFYIIGEKIVTMVSKMAATSNPNYLNLLVPKFFNEPDAENLTSAFNRAYSKSLEEVPFILADNGQVKRQKEIAIDDSGLSKIIGHDNFRELMLTDTCLPHESIDISILSKKIFNQLTRFSEQDVLNQLKTTEGRAFLSRWMKATDSNVKALLLAWFKQLIEGDTNLRNDIATLPIIGFKTGYFSINEVKESTNMCFKVGEISNITDILERIGLSCSNENITSSVLYESYRHNILRNNATTVHNRVINTINSYADSLTADEKRTLFDALVDSHDLFSPQDLNSLKLFKNKNGERAELSCLFKETANTPSYLSPYSIDESEYYLKIDEYLVGSDKIFRGIVSPIIDDLLNVPGITYDVIYKDFSSQWSDDFTQQLIKSTKVNVREIYNIVSASNKNTQLLFLNRISRLDLDGSHAFNKDSFEHQLLKLAYQVYGSTVTTYFSNKIFYNGKNLLQYPISDEVILRLKNLRGLDVNAYVSLSRILPGEFNSNTSAKLAIKNLFVELEENVLDAFFKSEPMPQDDIYRKLRGAFGFNTGTIASTPQTFNAIQYLFLAYYQTNAWNSSNMAPEVDLANMSNEFVNELLDVLYRYEINIHYCICTAKLSKYFRGYFNNEYILPVEAVNPKIGSWATDDNKKHYLIQNHIQDRADISIQFREAFDKDIPFQIDLLTENAVISSLDFFTQSNKYSFPLSTKNRCDLIKEVRRKWPKLITIKVDSSKLLLLSEEWDSKYYKEWNNGKGVKINIYRGLIPNNVIYKNTILCDIQEGDYSLLNGALYVSSEKSIDAVLFAVANDYSISCFGLTDYQALFVGKTNETEKEEIDRLKEEINQLKNKLSKAEVDDHGEYEEQGGLDSKERVEINKEACLKAKSFLEKDSRYNCTQWDPGRDGHIVKDKVLFNGKAIVVVVTSSRASKLYLHPYAFALLMENPDNLLLNYTRKDGVRSLEFRRVFQHNPNVNLIFDTDVITPDHFAKLAANYMYSQRTCFVIANPNYLASDEIKGFGLENKIDAEVLAINEDELFNGW